MTNNKTKEIYILESPKGIISKFNFNPIKQAEIKGREDMRKEVLDFTKNMKDSFKKEQLIKLLKEKIWTTKNLKQRLKE